MSVKVSTFVADVLLGDAIGRDIDDYVARWHQSDDERSLAEFLGFTDREYATWVEEPNALGAILYAKRQSGTPSALLSSVRVKRARELLQEMESVEAELQAILGYKFEGDTSAAQSAAMAPRREKVLSAEARSRIISAQRGHPAKQKEMHRLDRAAGNKAAMNPKA